MTLCPERVRGAMALLRDVHPAAQFPALENLCINNGHWDVPPMSAPLGAEGYAPIQYEIKLFGVPALANRPEDLPRHWLRAAEYALKAV